MRQSNIVANRQILAKDVNDLTSNVNYNQKILMSGIVGSSKGVVSGLDPLAIANTTTTFTLPSGIVTDGNGIFYEMMSNTTTVVNGSANTYKAYVQYSSTNDLPLSSYILQDVATRTVTFNTINSRTYDSLTVGLTTSSVPTNAEYIADVVWNGSAITSIVDKRTFTTIGNLTAYSLQVFSLSDALGTAYRTNKISGDIINENNTNAVEWLKINIDNAHAGVGIDINTGTNANAIGYIAQVNGNIGFKASGNVAASSGFVFNGSNNNGIALAATNLAKVIHATNYTYGGVFNNSANSQAILVNGVLNNDYGVKINSAFRGIEIDNCTIGLVVNSLTESTNDEAMVLNLSGNVQAAYGFVTTIAGGGTGHHIYHYNGSSTSISSVGLLIDNVSSSTTDTGINVGAGTSTNFLYGINLANCTNGLNIASCNNAVTINNPASHVGITITNNTVATGMIIHGTNQTGESAIFIDSARTGVKIYQPSGRGVYISGGARGVELVDFTDIGLNILLNNATFVSGTTEYVIVNNLNKKRNGIWMSGYNVVGMLFDGVSNPSSTSLQWAADIHFSNNSLINTTPIHMTCSDPCPNLPDATPLSGFGCLQFQRTTGSNVALKFFNGVSWLTVTAS